MFCLWGKIFRNSHMLRDVTVRDESDDTRTHKVFRTLESVCRSFDLGRPIWLDTNIRDFQRSKKTRFYQDNFIEPVDFDYLEIQILEE